MPIVLMTYYNIIYSAGTERLFRKQGNLALMVW